MLYDSTDMTFLTKLQREETNKWSPGAWAGAGVCDYMWEFGVGGVVEIDCGDSYICQNSQNCLLNFTVCKLFLHEMKRLGSPL